MRFMLIKLLQPIGILVYICTGKLTRFGFSYFRGAINQMACVIVQKIKKQIYLAKYLSRY